MPTINFSLAEPVRSIAQSMIADNHRHLIDNRVPMAFVYRDQDTQTKTKHRGYEVVLVRNLTAFLAGVPEQSQLFDPTTFVCPLCANWRLESEKMPLVVSGTEYTICTACKSTTSGWKMETEAVAGRFRQRQAEADRIQSNGPPEMPGVFVVVMHKLQWDGWSERTRRAVIDHCLCRCGSETDEQSKVRLFKRAYDIQEFTGVAERHGLGWRQDIAAFQRALLKHHQLNLGLDDVADDAGRAAPAGPPAGAGQKSAAAEKSAPPFWTKTGYFKLGDRVSVPGGKGGEPKIYVSRLNDNHGYDPEECSTYWRLEPASAIEEAAEPANALQVVTDGEPEPRRLAA